MKYCPKCKSYKNDYPVSGLIDLIEKAAERQRKRYSGAIPCMDCLLEGVDVDKEQMEQMLKEMGIDPASTSS